MRILSDKTYDELQRLIGKPIGKSERRELYRGGAEGTDLRWGKLTAAWTTGNTVTLTPCVSQTDGTPTGEANITCYLFSPSTAAPCGVYLASGDIIGYFPLPNDEGIATAVRFRNSLVIRGTATKTGGADGSFTTSATCGYVYTIADLDGNTLGTGKSPDRVRIPNCTYTVPSGAQPALLYQLADGTWGLIDVLTERPATASITYVADIRVTTTGVDKRPRECLVLDIKPLGDWELVHLGEQCPEPE